jgi:hypothetical protein
VVQVDAVFGHRDLSDRLNARGLLIALMIEAKTTSETLVNFYRFYMLEQPRIYLRSRRHANLKS